MKKKLLTIATLPYVKAQVLKTLLETEGIECMLEEVDLTDGTSALPVKIEILEEEVEKAFPIVEEFLGKPAVKTAVEDEKERHLLVPVDFSDYSMKAAQVAFNIAQKAGLKMVLFHSYPNPVAFSVPFSDVYAFDTGVLIHLENAEKAAQKSMESFLTDLIQKIGKQNWEKAETEYIIKAGDAQEDILSFAHKNHALLIVMGTQGKAGNRSDIIGSVTAEIISSARIPVLVVPPGTPENFAVSFSKVVYATNFDDKDFMALDKLMRLMQPYQAEIHCIHVRKDEKPEWDLARLKGMKELLHEKYGKQSFECHLLEGDDILDALEKFIEENQMDVLSLTTHKRSMLSRVFNPSVARKMAFHTNTPLLVFHA